MKRFRPYFHYLRAVRVPLGGALLCALVYGAANGAGLPLMVKWVFPKIFAADAAPLSTWALVLVALWLPAVFVVRGVAGYLNSYLIQLCGVRVLEALRLDFFRKLQVLPLSFLQRQTTGDLISRGLADTNQLQSSLTAVANDGIKQPATLIGALVTVAWITYHQRGSALMIASLVIVPLCVFPVRYIGKKLVKRAYQMQTQLGSLTNTLSENLSAAKEVRAFGLQDRQAKMF